MIGRLYTWRGQTWRVLARWGPIAMTDPQTWVCDCGRTTITPPRDAEGDVAIVCNAYGHRGHGSPFMRRVGGPVRNVLLVRVIRLSGVWPPTWHETDERVVRPFRGLRRWQP